MADIIIRSDGLEFVIQDLADLLPVLRILREQQLPMPLIQPTPAPRHNPPPVNGNNPTDEAFRLFYQNITGKAMQRFVDALYHRANGLSDGELRRLLGFETNLEIAGTITGIRKAERRAGLPDKAVITSNRRGRVGDYTYHYRVTPQCRQALQGIIPNQQNGEVAA